MSAWQAIPGGYSVQLTYDQAAKTFTAGVAAIAWCMYGARQWDSVIFYSDGRTPEVVRDLKSRTCD
jgi:hypothetical protein